jgi:hypothetical protein
MEHPSIQTAEQGATKQTGSRPPASQIRNHLTRNISPYLILLGLILLLPISFFALMAPLTPARMARDSVPLIAELPIWSAIASAPLPIPQNAQILALLLVVMTALAFGAYGAAVVLSWGAEATGRSRLIALIVAGKLPAWMILNNALAWVAGDDPIVNLLLYRGFLLSLSAANLLMIGLVLKKLHPQHLLTGILIYAWNPIVIILSGSKVDTVMAFYLLLAVILLLAHQRVLAVIALALSAFTKLVTLPLAAVTLLDHIRRRDWRRFLLESLVFGITVILIYAPFARDIGYFSRLIGLGQWASANTGTAAASIGSPVPIDLLLKIGLAVIVLLVGLRQDGSLPGMLRGWAIVLLYFSIFLMPSARYLITPIAVISLVPNRYIVALMIVISSASFLKNTWRTSFSDAFPAPDLFISPTFPIYIGTITLAGLTIGAYLIWRGGRNPVR